MRMKVLGTVAAVLIALGAVGVASASPPHDPFADLPDPSAVQPMDLVIDQRGLGYLRGTDGSLTPYGHSVAADRAMTPRGRGGQPGPPGSGGGGGIVTNGDWDGGQVHDSAGRILFEKAPGEWYVCSGTAVEDSVTGRSIVLTAAHCIYDDVAKTFALSAIFIPGQDDGGNDRTDWNCGNDPNGCWVLDHGVVDVNWTTRVFPDNIAWDYGYYVVDDSRSHSWSTDLVNLESLSLDKTVGTMTQSFITPSVGQPAHALGYSYAADPEFKYCTEDLGTNGSANYWLGSCALSGGSSGGPWVQPMNESDGTGLVFSVNSWGYTNFPGMAGPKLHDSSAEELFEVAKTSSLGGAGVIVTPGGLTTTTTTAPSTTEPPPEEGDLTATSTNNGKTWTATVFGPSDLAGAFDGVTVDCDPGACTLSGIAKKVGSVEFIATTPAGATITVLKP